MAQNTAAHSTAITHRSEAEPLQRRQPQDRRMHRGGRMDMPGVVMMMAVDSMVVIAHGKCYNITYGSSGQIG